MLLHSFFERGLAEEVLFGCLELFGATINFTELKMGLPDISSLLSIYLGN
jgi:hypothetical protein